MPPRSALYPNSTGSSSVLHWTLVISTGETMAGLRTLEEQPTMMMGQLKTLVVELMKTMPQK